MCVMFCVLFLAILLGQPAHQTEESRILEWEKLRQVVDTNIYPLDRHDEFAKITEHYRKEFSTNGIVTLPGFLRPNAIEDTVRNINSKIDSAWHTEGTHNLFLDDGDSTFSDLHIRNRQFPTQVASLAYDLLDQKGSLLQLYNNERFIEFLRGVLGVDTLFRLADPLGAASINIFLNGTKHSWHFDESTHSVTIMLQKPLIGGDFRYHPNTRKRGEVSQPLFLDLEDLVDDSSSAAGLAIKTLEFEPGTLSIFSGSTSLHEVSDVRGDVARYVAVFCFSAEPNKTNSPQVQQLFWGRQVPPKTDGKEEL